MDVDRTKRRDAEFAEKNAENVEGVIEKKLSVRLCDLSDLLCGSLISSAAPEGHSILDAFALFTDFKFLKILKSYDKFEIPRSGCSLCSTSTSPTTPTNCE